MLTQNTQAFLNDLRKSGGDPVVIASLERELDTKPALAQATDRGILAQASFGQYQSQKEQEIKGLKNQLTELASLKGALATSTDSGVVELLTQRIAALENVLINEEHYDPDEVKAISFDDSENEIVNKLKAHLLNKEKASKEMPNNNLDPTKRYIEEGVFVDSLKNVAGNMAALNIGMSARIAGYLRKADKLGIEVPDERINEFHTGLVQAMDRDNKSPDQFADEFFGFSTKRAELQKADFENQLKAAEEKGAQEALKSAGVEIRRNIAQPKVPVLERLRNMQTKSSTDDMKTLVDEFGSPKPGHPLHYSSRPRSREERRAKHSASATERFNELAPHYDETTETYASTVHEVNK